MVRTSQLRALGRQRGRPALRRSAVVVGAIIATGCASITHTPFGSAADPSATPSVSGAADDDRFPYRPGPVDATNHMLASGGRYLLRRITFPSEGDNGQTDDLVTVDYHQSRLPGAHPAVLVLPIWGRHVYPSNAVTRTLKKRSNGAVHVLNVLGEEFLIDWPALAEVTTEAEFVDIWRQGAEREITTVIDMRRLMDWAEGRPEIDGRRLGVIGFSHGAIFAPALAAQDSRVEALVLVMGGAHPHQVIARCTGARTETIQIRAAELFGWGRDDMEDVLEPFYRPMDPASYTGRFDPASVLIFEAGRDECVPESSREALWEATGRPDRYVIEAEHRNAFYTMTPLRLNWMRKKIWRFVEERLLEPERMARSRLPHR